MAFVMRKGFFDKALRAAKKYNPTPIKYTQNRFLNLHEYRAKELLARHGVRVQRGILASTPKQAKENAVKLRGQGARDLIVKSQILAGGRGKGHFNTGFKGGVKVCQSPEEVEQMAAKMLGNHLITNQTGPEGQLVSCVLIHEGVDFKKEYYLAILMERAFDGPVIMGSPMGGMDIEEVAEKHPDKIKTLPIDVKEGLSKATAKEMAQFIGFQGKAVEDAVHQFLGCMICLSKMIVYKSKLIP